ncbi:sigma-70 family RNA polymerase sigma factor [Amycolatopsis sp. K13G38]|uniref:Sigma-70 family RNA polymerase sigma factor n=1 Tax=Amycolatopsis acididurans TaxID=2724524 RepID=A0ABX1JGE4_9PSEU|nr:sigma-70 family RNA polymerase sigma factor [Amycolatopsis acididurans]NKQ58814.1 sigma-70 family RNA polymerase sigma factor [Amycolatopsis acididurans]
MTAACIERAQAYDRSYGSWARSSGQHALSPWAPSDAASAQPLAFRSAIAPDDAWLIRAVRDGNIAAYGELYVRHVAAAYNLARQLARSAIEADDLVSEAFSKVLSSLQGGRGPDSAFRAYLLTALRHTAYDKTRRDRKVELTEDVTTAVNPVLVSVQFDDTASAGLEKELAANAFARLPERWQTVLWLTEIESRSPAEVGPKLGLTANGVSALAYRAREGLRQAYLQEHLAGATGSRCQPTVDRLGAWTRRGLPTREAQQVRDHLAECGSCRTLSLELAEINTSFRVRAAGKRSCAQVGKSRRQQERGRLPSAALAERGTAAVKLAS